MAVNSCEKGKRAERAAAKYLRSLGFTTAQRGQQHKGGSDSPDLVVKELPNIHFECKWDEKITLQSRGKKESLEAAMDQSSRESGPGQVAVVLWKRNKIPWRLTYMNTVLGKSTVCGDHDIAQMLTYLNQAP